MRDLASRAGSGSICVAVSNRGCCRSGEVCKGRAGELRAWAVVRVTAAVTTAVLVATTTVHDHGHYEHEHRGWLRGWLASIVRRHSHDAIGSIDSALESSEEGIRALKISLVVLAVTAVLQLAVVAVSGSVALLADTIHNFSDALTAVPLWVAFVLSRRAPTRRCAHG